MCILGVETDVPGLTHFLLPYLGIPGTMLAILLWAMVKGWIISGREAAKDSVACKAANEELKARLLEQDKLHREQMTELKTEKDMWRDTALGNLRALERATETAKRAADTLDKRA